VNPGGGSIRTSSHVNRISSTNIINTTTTNIIIIVIIIILSYRSIAVPSAASFTLNKRNDHTGMSFHRRLHARESPFGALLLIADLPRK